MWHEYRSRSLIEKRTSLEKVIRALTEGVKKGEVKGNARGEV